MGRTSRNATARRARRGRRAGLAVTLGCVVAALSVTAAVLPAPSPAGVAPSVAAAPPASSSAAPDDRAPADPVPLDPAPAPAPAPADPAAVDPAPVDPAPVDPAPVDPAPADRQVVDLHPGAELTAVTAGGPTPDHVHAEAGRPAQTGPAGPGTSTGTVEDTAPATRTPAAPAPGVVRGTLVRLWAEVLEDQGGHEGDGAELRTWVETPTTAYPVEGAPVADVQDASTVTLDLGAAPAGAPHPVRRVLTALPPVAAAGEVLYGQGSADVFGVAAAAVTHDVTVVLATPQGATRDGTTSSTLAATVSGGAHTFWSQQSRGQRGFRVAARHEWQSLTSTCSNPFTLWKEVATKVGFVAGPRKHLLVYLPPSAGCGAGLGTVGWPDAGGSSWVSYAETSIVAHELGHNLGLGHSNGLLCAGRADARYASGAWPSGCAAHEYRDYYDVMGVSWGNLGSLAAPHADALGVVLSTEKIVVSAPTRVRLVPATSDGLRVLRVDDPGGTYYVEHRVATGQDSWLASNIKGLDAGVLVHRRSPVDATQVLLLDGSVTAGPRTDDWRSALAVGSSLVTASGATRIVVEEAGASGATVAVHRDGVAPSSVVPPADGSQVQIQAPTTASSTSATVFSGVATAPEGTLLWEVLHGGVVRGSGVAQTGANGTFGAWQVPVALPPGTVTFRIRVPDDSDGEGLVDPALMQDERTLTVS